MAFTIQNENFKQCWDRVTQLVEDYSAQPPPIQLQGHLAHTWQFRTYGSSRYNNSTDRDPEYEARWGGREGEVTGLSDRAELSESQHSSWCSN